MKSEDWGDVDGAPDADTSPVRAKRLRPSESVLARNTNGLAWSGRVVRASHRWALVSFEGKLPETRVSVVADADGRRTVHPSDVRPHWVFR